MYHIATRMGTPACRATQVKLSDCLPASAFAWKEKHEKCVGCIRIYKERKTNFNLLNITGKL